MVTEAPKGADIAARTSRAEHFAQVVADDLLAFPTGLYLRADQLDDPLVKALKDPVVIAIKAVP